MLDIAALLLERWPDTSWRVSLKSEVFCGKAPFEALCVSWVAGPGSGEVVDLLTAQGIGNLWSLVINHTLSAE